MNLDVELAPVFGLGVAPLQMEQVVDLAEQAVDERSRLLVGVVNAAKVVKLHHDSFLRDSLLECDLLLADGQSVVWAAKVLRHPLPERVAGCDLFEELLALADRDRRRVFLLGAKAEVLDLVVEQIEQRWPGVQIVGARDGYFTEAESDAVAEQVRASRADMLFLGMTTPKKEIFLGRYADGLGVPVLHGVGGSFDVMAGVTKRAPLAWQRAGMEWAYRLLQEPRRLWRRYLVTNTLFVLTVLRELVHPRAVYVRPVAAQPQFTVPTQRPASSSIRIPGQRGVWDAQRAEAEQSVQERSAEGVESNHG